MTKDEALKLALESGYKDLPTVRLAYQGFDIQHFTNLVIATERHRVLAEEREALAQPEHPEQMARLGWQYVECPACGSEGARAFPKPAQELAGYFKFEDNAWQQYYVDYPRPEELTLLYKNP